MVCTAKEGKTTKATKRKHKMDHNPHFGKDESYDRSARTVADLLWSTSQGELSRIPPSYLQNLEHVYSDGAVSLLGQLNKLSMGSQPSYEDFVESVEALIKVDPSEWPEPDSIVELPVGKLLHEVEPEPFEFSDGELDFAEPADMSSKIELFLKKVISSVYTDGVTSVTDKGGNPPNARNGYLMSSDGKSFSGLFFDSPPGKEVKKFPFRISETEEGWEILY